MFGSQNQVSYFPRIWLVFFVGFLYKHEMVKGST
jgi:hypothetical protein